MAVGKNLIPIQNLVKHLRWSSFCKNNQRSKAINYYCKTSSIADVLLDPKHASENESRECLKFCLLVQDVHFNLFLLRNLRTLLFIFSSFLYIVLLTTGWVVPVKKKRNWSHLWFPCKNNCNWEKAFSNTNINEKVSLFNKTILNIPNNYILHGTIICDDRDPPWFNSRVKSLFENENKIRKNYQRFKPNSQLLSKLSLLQEQLYLLINNKSKQNYYSRAASKLTNVQRNYKTYWSLLNRFLINKKIPLIPPLFYENKFMTDFKEKAEYFNALFAKQWPLIKNSSKCPSHLHFLTDNRLSSVSFSQDDIGKIIQNSWS